MVTTVPVALCTNSTMLECLHMVNIAIAIVDEDTRAMHIRMPKGKSY